MLAIMLLFTSSYCKRNLLNTSMQLSVCSRRHVYCLRHVVWEVATRPEERAHSEQAARQTGLKHRQKLAEPGP